MCRGPTGNRNCRRVEPPLELESRVHPDAGCWPAPALRQPSPPEHCSLSSASLPLRRPPPPTGAGARVTTVPRRPAVWSSVPRRPQVSSVSPSLSLSFSSLHAISTVLEHRRLLRKPRATASRRPQDWRAVTCGGLPGGLCANFCFETAGCAAPFHLAL
jgi:hypothetical protein